MESTIDTIKRRREFQQSTDPDRIRGTLNEMIKQQIEQQRTAPRKVG